MKTTFRNAVTGLLLSVTTQAAFAQSIGDAKAGSAYADQICSECHAVRSGGRVSPNEKAPAFQVVADTRGMSEMALRAWFRTPHPSMPNLVIRDKEADDVIAYILSLKRRQ
jgi:mono/diheme cytochrome c family protein